jgi:hypothetical protein
MGMFDYVICEMPLQNYPEGYELRSFQSKETPSQGMSTYKISEDGFLFVKRVSREWKECLESPTGFSEIETDLSWDLCSYYTGSFEFYDYRRHPNYDYDYPHYYEAGLFLYKAIVKSGKVEMILPIEIKLPRELSEEEIDVKEAEAQKAREKMKKEMILLRKNAPTKTQRMVDSIDNLIQNKPAIYDRSDLISILNNISAIISEWRKENDPFYEN